MTAAIVLVGLHTPAGRRFVLSRVTRFLASQQIDLRADQLSFNLFDLSLNLHDIRIASLRSSQDPPFAVISQLDADVSLLDLIGGRYVVESGMLEGVKVHYVVHADGTDDVPRPPRDPDAPSEPLDYLIASLAVSNATVRYENRAQQIDATFPVRTTSVQGNRVTDRHAVSLVATGGELQARGRRARLDRLSANVDLGDDDLRVMNARADAEGSPRRASRNRGELLEAAIGHALADHDRCVPRRCGRRDRGGARRRRDRRGERAWGGSRTGSGRADSRAAT